MKCFSSLDLAWGLSLIISDSLGRIKIKIIIIKKDKLTNK